MMMTRNAAEQFLAVEQARQIAARSGLELTEEQTDAIRAQVKQILDIREDGGLLCGESLSLDGCTPRTSIVANQIFPEPTYAASVFTIVADASVGEIHRSVEAVINRAPDPPLVLSWKVR